jgi:hypothetical protein
MATGADMQFLIATGASHSDINKTVAWHGNAGSAPFPS